MIGVGPRKGPHPSRGMDPQWTMRGLQLAFLAAVSAAWQLLSRDGRLGGVSPPSEVVSSLFEIVGRGEVWDPLLDTLSAWLIGLGLAVLIAVPIGFVLGRSWLLYRMSRLVIDFCRTIPSLALLPLALLLYGTGVRSKVLLIVFACVWPLLLQTIYGVRDIDTVAHDTFRSYRIRRRDVVTRLVLPTSWPYLATGLRLAATVSLLLALQRGDRRAGAWPRRADRSCPGRRCDLGDVRLHLHRRAGGGRDQPAVHERRATDPALAPVTTREGDVVIRRLTALAVELAVPVAIVAAWWVLSDSSTSPYFPPLSRIVERFRELWLFELVGEHVVPSLINVLAGTALAYVIGVAGGVALGLLPRAAPPSTRCCSSSEASRRSRYSLRRSGSWASAGRCG